MSARDRLVRKDRQCRSCLLFFPTTAQEIVEHAQICSFEQRTGLQVVQRGRGFEIVRLTDNNEEEQVETL